MRRLVALLSSVVCCFCISACSQNEPLSGDYVDVSFGDPIVIYTDIVSDVEGIEQAPKTLSITEESGNYTFRDNLHSGSCSLNSDSIELHREKVITENEVEKRPAEILLEQTPDITFLRYKDYLIQNTPLDINKINGKLPVNEKKTDCSLLINNITYKNFTLDLFENGTCEIEATFSSTVNYFYCGTYELEGPLVLLTFTEGKSGDIELSGGSSKMTLYVNEDSVYGTIYKKSNETI